MKAEEKQALIAWLEEGVACSDEYGFNGNTLKSMKIALAALTAPQVKLPDVCGYEHPEKEAPFYTLNKDEVVAAIRDAGYEVQQ